jgi:ElaB/YqjD/DUF883 family membrane-anchored ribosome-binding protein
MPATKRGATSRSARKGPTGNGAGDAGRPLQQALDELAKLRDQSGGDLRKQLDSAVKRVREAGEELRERTDERTAAVERAVGRVADEAWQQLATIAIRAMSNPDALTELSGEIRKRKAQLRPPAKRTATRKAS